MGIETVIFAIIVGAFAAFMVFVGVVDFIADEKAITFEQERAARTKAAPVKAEAIAFKQAA